MTDTIMEIMERYPLARKHKYSLHKLLGQRQIPPGSPVFCLRSTTTEKFSDLWSDHRFEIAEGPSPECGPEGPPTITGDATIVVRAELLTLLCLRSVKA